MGCWGAIANLKRAPWAGEGIAACPAITPTRFGWINFLDLLRARHTDYVINEAALDDMRGPALRSHGSAAGTLNFVVRAPQAIETA
jgi:hypothetical protein